MLCFTSPRFASRRFTSPRFTSPRFAGPRFTSPVQSSQVHEIHTYFRLSFFSAENSVCGTESINDFCDVAPFVFSLANQIT